MTAPRASAHLDTWRALFAPGPTRARLDGFRDRRVRTLVAHAYETVPYYRRLFDEHGIAPATIRGVGDLPRLPITTRATLQSLDATDIVQRGVDRSRLLAFQSSGSTGRRLVVRRTWTEERLLRAIANRVGRQMGRRPWERGARLEVPARVRTRDPRRPGALLPRLQLFRDQPIDCLADPAQVVAELRRCRPRVVGGFPPVLARLAHHVGDGGLTDLRLRAVVTGGDVLTPSARRRIAAAFGAPVHETYGSIECQRMAWQCPDGDALHCCDDGLVTEIVRDGVGVGEGEVGEVVVTALHSFAMPLIRYQIGDLATQGRSRCDCGLPCGTIHGVVGRMLDYFTLPDGRVLHPYELTMPMLAAHPWVAHYRLTQERIDRVVLHIAPDPRPDPDAVASIRRHCRDRLGPDVEFAIELVDEIPIDPSGKLRVSRSLVRQPFDT